jgi:anti-sigma factor RsiW
MSLPHDTVLELMALADGELDGDDKARAERTLAASAEARLLVEGFRANQLAQWLREPLEERAAAADGIADAVMARVAHEGAEERVVRLSTGKGGKGRMGMAAPMAFAALSLAAGVAMTLHEGDRPRDTGAPVATMSPPGADDEPQPSALAQRATPPQGVEVDEIDSLSRDVSIFEIPVGTPAAAAANGHPPSSVVIMIEDDPAAK